MDQFTKVIASFESVFGSVRMQWLQARTFGLRSRMPDAIPLLPLDGHHQSLARPLGTVCIGHGQSCEFDSYWIWIRCKCSIFFGITDEAPTATLGTVRGTTNHGAMVNLIGTLTRVRPLGEFPTCGEAMWLTNGLGKAAKRIRSIGNCGVRRTSACSEAN